MQWKTTLCLLALTVGIGTYLSLYEIRQPSPQARDRIAREILDLPEESVTRLAIHTPQHDLTLTLDGKTWRLDPDHGPADTQKVERLLLELSPLMAERTLTGSPAAPLDLKSFGLDPPAGTLSVTSHGAQTTLAFGDATAVGDNRYLQVGGRPEVFVVSPMLCELLNRPAEALRAKVDQPSGSKDALHDGGVGQHGEEHQRPPEQVPSQGTP